MSKKIVLILFFCFFVSSSITGHASTSVTTVLSVNASAQGFSGAISYSGDYILCGDTFDDDDGQYAGAAYIFKNINNTWTRTAKLKPSDGAADKIFGGAVSLDGDYAAISSIESLQNTMYAGSVYIFHRNGETWTQTAKITPQIGLPESFGASISLQGDRLLIGEYADSDISGIMAGVAYIYQRTGTNWIETARLLPADLALWDYFGTAVTLHDNYAMIGAPFEDGHGTSSGVVYVFQENGGSWTEVAKLTASDASQNSLFGNCIDLSDNYAIIASVRSNNEQGAAYIFEKRGDSWIETEKLIPSDGWTAGQYFGSDVSITEQYAIVGAPSTFAVEGDIEAAYIFKRNNSNWTEIEKITNSLTNYRENFGNAVVCRNNTFIVGAPGFYGNNSPGKVYIFELQQVPPPPVTGYTYYLPGFNTESGYWTGLGLTNRQIATTATVNAKIFSNQGVHLRTELISIDGGGQKAGAIGSGLAAQGWVQLDSTTPLAGLCFIGSNSGMADVPVTETLENSLVVPHIAQDDFWDTTLMVCNPNDNAISLQIIYRDISGSELASRTYPLLAFGGAVYPLAEIFSGFIPLAGSITLQATPGIAAFALYSNLKTGTGKSFAGINAVATK